MCGWVSGWGMGQAFNYLRALFLHFASYIKDCMMKFDLTGAYYPSNFLFSTRKKLAPKELAYCPEADLPRALPLTNCMVWGELF